MKKLFWVITISILAMVAGTAVADNSVSRTSNLIDARAVDADGQALGTISDLVIAEDNQLSYIVVSKTDGSLVALPFTAASPRVNPDREVVLAVTKKDFDSAPSFASNNWPDMTTESDVARGYRPNYGDSWKSTDLKQVNGIWTANPYPF